jgi:hypothetical protein
MSRGRHTRPRARGGGLELVLAFVLVVGAIALVVTSPSSTALRIAVAALAVVAALGLLTAAAGRRQATRAVARTEERLRVLEQRNRDEGDELHRRVLESIRREGELRNAVVTLSTEIGRLRASLEAALQGVVVPLGATITLPAEAEPDRAAAAEDGSTLDLPLVQRVLAAQEAAAATEAQPRPVTEAQPRPVTEARPTPATEAQPTPATEAPPTAAPAAPRTPPAAPAPLPRPALPKPALVAAPAAAAPGTEEGEGEELVRAWVVRELQLPGEPGAALTMRILDLTTSEQAQPAPATRHAHAGRTDEADVWAPPRFARPA